MSSTPRSVTNTVDNIKSTVTNIDWKKKPNGVAEIALQVFIGLIFVYVIYFGSILVMNVDKLVINEKYEIAKKRRVPVIDGYIDASAQVVSFNTMIPLANNYLPIRPSVNIKGGAQFTYNFWMYADPSANVAHKVLFLKGDKEKYTFTITDNFAKKPSPIVRTKEHMVFCPQVKFGADMQTFEILFNTFNKHDEKMIINTIRSEDSVSRNNLLSTLYSTWFMITITFEDNIPINDFENGIQVKFYVNDALYKIQKFPSALKQNQGDLHLFPNESSKAITNVKISNFNYYNYIISEKEIKDLLYAGANTKPSTAYIPSVSTKPPVLSDYNKLDIYNN